MHRIVISNNANYKNSVFDAQLLIYDPLLAQTNLFECGYFMVNPSGELPPPLSTTTTSPWWDKGMGQRGKECGVR